MRTGKYSLFHIVDAEAGEVQHVVLALAFALTLHLLLLLFLLLWWRYRRRCRRRFWKKTNTSNSTEEEG